MKRIYTDISDIAHAWAHQTLEPNKEEYYEAANPQRNFYYTDKSIYSYGRHFEIARIICQQPHVILMTTRTRSNTTARHIGVVRRAIPEHWTTFNVAVMHDNKPHKNDLQKNVDSYISTIEQFVTLQKKARTANYTGSVKRWVEELRGYVKYFKADKRLPKHYRFLLADDFDPSDMQAVMLQFGVVVDAKILAVEKQKKALKAKQAKLLKEWLAGQHGKSAVAAILGNEIKLRVVSGSDPNTKVVQTSKGIELALEDCSKLWRVVKLAKGRKVSLPRDGEEISVSGWTVNRIDPEGNITAGCHKVKFNEAERVAKLLGFGD